MAEEAAPAPAPPERVETVDLAAEAVRAAVPLGLRGACH